MNKIKLIFKISTIKTYKIIKILNIKFSVVKKNKNQTTNRKILHKLKKNNNFFKSMKQIKIFNNFSKIINNFKKTLQKTKSKNKKINHQLISKNQTLMITNYLINKLKS